MTTTTQITDTLIIKPKPKRSLPLYSIRPDAVLIHPYLPGFPLTNPPTVVAALGSPSADFLVASALPPVDWHGVLSWYGIRQPRRAHIWSIRALLHLYLLLAAHRDVGDEGGISLTYIHEHPKASYQSLLDEGTHYVGNFWTKAPEMLLLALHSAKENHVARILQTLLLVAERSDKDYDSGTVQALLNALRSTHTIVREAVAKNILPALQLTRRRAGIIERGLADTIRRSFPEFNPGALPRVAPAMSHDPKHIALHKTSMTAVVGPALEALTRPMQATHATPNPPDTPTAPTNPSTEHTHV